MDSGSVSRLWSLRQHVSGTGRVRKHRWHGNGPAGERRGWRQSYSHQFGQRYDGRNYNERERLLHSDPFDPGDL